MENNTSWKPFLWKLQPAGVASWHVFLRNTDQVRMLVRQEMLEQCNQSPTWKVCFTKETCGDIYLHHQHRHQHHQHHQHHQQQHHQHTDSPGHQLIGVSLQGTHLFSRASIQKTQIHAIRPVFPCIGQESVKTIRESYVTVLFLLSWHGASSGALGRNILKSSPFLTDIFNPEKKDTSPKSEKHTISCHCLFASNWKGQNQKGGLLSSAINGIPIHPSMDPPRRRAFIGYDQGLH